MMPSISIQNMFHFVLEYPRYAVVEEEANSV